MSRCLLHVCLAAMACGACVVDIDFSGSNFRCTQSSECPAGQTCVNQVCGGGIDASALDASGQDAPADAAVGACPVDCVPIATASCLCGTFLTWDQARIDCEQNGRRLVRVESAAESDAIRQAIADAAFAVTWLGGADLLTEGEFRWTEGDVFWQGGLGGGAPAGTFAEFGADEPNDVNANEDCVQLNEVAWNDAPCSVQTPYVCGPRDVP